MADEKKVLDKNGLLYYHTQLKSIFQAQVSGKGLSTEDYTTAEKNKLAGIATGANKTTVDSSLSSTSTNPVQNKVINTALAGKVDTVSGKGLSANDFTNALKTKLEGIETGATKVTVDSTITEGGTNPVQGGAIHTALSGKVDTENGKGLSTNDFTDAFKTKLEGIATGANKTTVDSALSSSSTNPVQNKVINTALGGKVDTVTGKGLSTNDFTDTLKNKLDGIEAGANNYSLPTAANGTLGGVTTTSTVSSASGYTAVPIISGVPYYKNTTYSAATASANGLMSKEDYSKLAAFSAASDYALKSDIASMYKYKGSVATIASLPSSGNTAGDVYNVTSNGKNYAWTGTEWDDLGGEFSIETITNAEIDTIIAS